MSIRKILLPIMDSYVIKTEILNLNYKSYFKLNIYRDVQKIYNPITERSVNVDGKLGINILKNYLNQSGGETKKDIVIYIPDTYFGLTKEETEKRLKRMKKELK